jgi:hypothetical protein
MKKRLKLLQEHACLLRCRGCGNLLITMVRTRPKGQDCLWQELLDADLRAPRPTEAKLSKANAELLCENCAAAKPLNYAKLSDEQLEQFEHLVTLLLGDEDGDPNTPTQKQEPSPETIPAMNAILSDLRKKLE